MASALGIGALQMFHVRGGFLTNYGADVLGTAWLYGMTRLGWTIIQRGRPTSSSTAAALIFSLCTLSELGQRAGLVPGRYDPYDIGAFAFAVLGCLALERVFGPFVESTPREAPSLTSTPMPS